MITGHKQMKILFVSTYPFLGNNSGMMRNRALINGLHDLGHSVDVLSIKSNKLQQTISPNEVSVKKFYYAGDNKLYDYLTSQNSAESRIKNKIASFLRKIYHMVYPFDYTMSIARNVSLDMLETSEYNIVISSSDPKSSHIAMDKLIQCGLKYDKWIQYWGDPLSNNIAKKDCLPQFILRKIEKSIMKKADKIVYVSPFTYEYECNTHKKLSKKFCWLPIPYNNVVVVGGNRKYISYFGDYVSKTRDIMPFYNAARNLKCQTIIAGDGDLEIQSIDNITVIPRGDISSYLWDTKILIVLMNKKGTQIPGKIYHDAGTNLPILIISDGDYGKDIEKYFDKYNRFRFCSNVTDDICSTLEEMINDYSLLNPLKEFDRLEIAKSFINIIS